MGATLPAHSTGLRHLPQVKTPRAGIAGELWKHQLSLLCAHRITPAPLIQDLPPAWGAASVLTLGLLGMS